MTDSVKLLDAVLDMRETASSVANSLEDVAAVLNEVGMEKIVKRLDAAANRLVEASKRLYDSYGDDLTDRLNHSSHMEGQLVLLALQSATEKAGG